MSEPCNRKCPKLPSEYLAQWRAYTKEYRKAHPEKVRIWRKRAAAKAAAARAAAAAVREGGNANAN